MAKKFFASLTILGVMLMSAPVSLFAQAPMGAISGTATGPGGEVLANTRAQVRDLTSKQLVGTTTTNAQGAFSFTGLTPGTYVVEILNAQGAIIGTTPVITLTPAALVATGVTVSATAAGAITGGAAAAGGVGGGFFGTTAGIITAVAVGGGVIAAVIAVQDDASPSR